MCLNVQFIRTYSYKYALYLINLTTLVGFQLNIALPVAIDIYIFMIEVLLVA